MPDPVRDLIAPALGARLLLAANHVLAAHPLAPGRLKPHAGRSLKLQLAGWPSPPAGLPLPALPAPPPVALMITPAGLLEAHPLDAACDLTLTVQAADPMRVAQALLSGGLPPVDLQGDAALAADVSWVLANVRWDFAADLERVFGPIVADGAARAAAGAAQAARALAERLRPGGA